MNRERLLDELTEDVFAYVLHGELPEEEFVGRIRPDGLDERFDDFESLVRLHFVLRDDVVEFVERLPTRIRRVKTQTRNVSSTRRGRIDGRVDWTATIRERHSRAPGDASLFVCENRTEDYDVPENVVLKRLLSLIHRTLDDCREHLQREYDWVTDRWRENLELVDVLTDIVERNVHVTRIREPSEYEPTERMLRAAEESRSEVYREAADLLRSYREAAAGQEAAIEDLIRRTAITPDDEETLLELFVLFKYIRAVEAAEDDSFTIRTLASGKQEVACLETGDRELVLYHDNSGRDRGLSFTPSVTEGKSSLTRHERVHRETVALTDEYFTDTSVRERTNRPDVIVLEVRDDERHEYLVTEVKNSSRVQTVRAGIRETLEYLAFLRHDDEFVFDEDTDFLGSGWNGVLVVQDIHDRETRPVEDQRGIRVLQASEVEEELGSVLENVLDPPEN